MEITLRKDGDIYRIRIHGTLEVAQVPDFNAAIKPVINAKPQNVFLDLSLLRLVDSRGLAAIVSFTQLIVSQQGSVVIDGLRDQPLDLFRLMRLDRFFSFGA